MAQVENLYHTTKNFLTPDSIRKFSLALDESKEKIEAGLQNVVPTLVEGIINEGSTSEGAQKLVTHLKSKNYNGTLPSNLNDHNYLVQGEHVIEDIFGDEYRLIASSLTPATGMDSKNIEKLMEMAAPAVLGAIGNRIKVDKLNAKNLSGFLMKQKNYVEVFNKKSKIPFSAAVVLFVIIGLSSLWFLIMNVLPVSIMKRNIASIEDSVTQPELLSSSVNGLSLQELPTFLSAPSTDLPKRFTFNSLSFAPGTTDMNADGYGELELIAKALARYPKATATVEAYIEDTGDADENLMQSENRAMLIREELIGRGIEPSRIKAQGRGPKAEKNQLYFVINAVK